MCCQWANILFVIVLLCEAGVCASKCCLLQGLTTLDRHYEIKIAGCVIQLHVHTLLSIARHSTSHDSHAPKELFCAHLI